MFLPNVILNPAKYWNRYVDFMSNFKVRAVNLAYLTWLMHLFGVEWRDRQMIDLRSWIWTRSFLLATYLVGRWHWGRQWVFVLDWVGFPNCQTWVFHIFGRVFHIFGWVFHKFTENVGFYMLWFLTLSGKKRDPCVGNKLPGHRNDRSPRPWLCRCSTF